MPATVFWIYVSASLIFLAGVIKVFNELPQEHGVDKIMPFGRLFFAIPMAVFGSEHFTATASIATLVPRWIPAHLFWVYLVGLAFLCAALAIAVLIQARLAATLVGATMFVFVSSWTCQPSLRTPTADSRGPWRLDSSPSAAVRSLLACRRGAPGRELFRDSSWAFLRSSTESSICCTRHTCPEFRCNGSLQSGFPGEFS